VDSMNYIFPMFRGIGLLILYLWGVAWNVYGFTKYRINHRLILEYGSHYSTHFQIMKRAGFFTLVFSLMLLIYCIIESTTTKNDKERSVNLVIYTPFVVWVLYFAYIFFPNRDVFNPKGRRYFYDLLKKIFFSPIIKVRTFRFKSGHFFDYLGIGSSCQFCHTNQGLCLHDLFLYFKRLNRFSERLS
jgi:hypothetical protein